MNVTAHQEKEKNEETKKGRRKRENRQPILKKLCAALLRSFRGQHSEKIKGCARGNWDPREFRPNPNGVWDRAAMLRRLLIGAVVMLLQWRSGHKMEWKTIFLSSFLSFFHLQPFFSIPKQKSFIPSQNSCSYSMYTFMISIPEVLAITA